MAGDPTAKLRRLLTDVLSSHASAQSRAEAAEAAALRLAQRMLADDHDRVFKKNAGFACDERNYGDGSASYLTNAQGLVGVLLPFVEVPSARPTGSESAKILEAAQQVLRQTQRDKATTGVWFSLEPYVGLGWLRKNVKEGLDRFYSTSGVSWSLSSLVLLYLAYLLGKIELRDELKPSNVIAGIETTYDLLLRSFVQSGDRAGWGWSSLSTAPDLYHTWSASQTLGDLEDYVFAPPPEHPLGQDPKLHELSDRLHEKTPRALLTEDAKSPTDFIYRKTSQWLYKELTASDSPAVREEVSSFNAPENDVYYTYFLIESLVYMHADQLLPGDPKTIRDTLYERLFSASLRLDRLRATDWYKDPDRSTLHVPLPFGKTFLPDQILEPSLEPLVMRALSYGPLYLGRRDPVDFIEAALKRHGGMLDDELDLWDDAAPNFLICERTIEALLMVRNMFRSLPAPVAESSSAGVEPPDARGEILLTLAGDQVARLVNEVAERLKEPIREQIGQLPLPRPGGDGILQAVDPVNYREIARSDKILTYVDHIVEVDETQIYQGMLIDTIVAILTALFDPQRSTGAERAPSGLPRASDRLAEAFASAVAAAIPSAVAKYLQSQVEAMDDAEIRGRFDAGRVESQLSRVAAAYVQKEFRNADALDLAGRLAEALEMISTRGGGFA